MTERYYHGLCTARQRKHVAFLAGAEIIFSCVRNFEVMDLGG